MAREIARLSSYSRRATYGSRLRRFSGALVRLYGGEIPPRGPAAPSVLIAFDPGDNRKASFPLKELTNFQACDLGFMFEELNLYAIPAVPTAHRELSGPGQSAPASRLGALNQRCRQASQIPESFANSSSRALPCGATPMMSARTSAGNAYGAGSQSLHVQEPTGPGQGSRENKL